jgi:chlorite dismutase
MSARHPTSFNHFASFSLTPDYWALSDSERAALRESWVEALGPLATAAHHFRTFPGHAASDVLVWCAIDSGDPGVPKAFFDGYAAALRPFREYLRPVDFMWGFTRSSSYSKARSKQEIDPFHAREQPYLVMYPFTKTADWYLKDRETRQEMMNAHMRIGKSYEDITQLLLYSVGLQEQEFVVVYETDDLARFSELVSDLRATEARAYTLKDTPVYIGVHRPVSEPGELWP